MSNKICPKNCLGNCKECELDEKKDKAIEIIKDKNVWFWVFRRTHNVDEYNELVNSYYSECAELTQEEFNLLKEVLL